MAVTLTTSGAVLIKAGKNVSSDLTGVGNTTLGKTADQIISQYINEAEAVINSETRYNWIDGYAGLNDDVKNILNEVASNIAAMYAVTYDMSGYTSRIEAETIMDVLIDSAKRGLSLLKDKKVETFIKGA